MLGIRPLQPSRVRQKRCCGIELFSGRASAEPATKPSECRCLPPHPPTGGVESSRAELLGGERSAVEELSAGAGTALDQFGGLLVGGASSVPVSGLGQSAASGTQVVCCTTERRR